MPPLPRLHPSLLRLLLWPLLLPGSGCGPQLVGTWDIALWEVTRAGSPDVIGDIDDVGWVVLVDSPDTPFGLLRYFWSDASTSFQPLAEPLLVDYSGDPDDADEEDWRLVGEGLGSFALEDTNDTEMILRAEGWPAGLETRWYLERQ